MDQAKEAEVQYLEFLAVVERKTANTVLFEEVVAPDGQEISGRLYVKKKALARLGNPKLIRVRIEPGRTNGTR